MSNQRLIEHNRKVVDDICKNNSKEGFEKRQRKSLEQTKDVANEALDYIQRKGTGTHQSNHKRIDEVKRYYGKDTSPSRSISFGITQPITEEEEKKFKNLTKEQKLYAQFAIRI